VESDPLGLVHRHRSEADEAPLPSRPEQRWALVRLAGGIAAILAVAYAFGVGETVLLVFAIFVCVLLHELGHFLTARAAGIKVTEFFVGFGRRLWSIRRGETEYGVKALPLGGYCRIIGMHNLDEVDPADEPRTYRQKPVWRRLSVAVAGSTVHFLIAFFVLFSMFFWTGDSGFYLTNLPSTNPIVAVDGLRTGIAATPQASPAQQAGFHLGDRILAVDGHHYPRWTDMTAYIQAHPDQRLDVTVRRGGQVLHLFPTTVDGSKVQLTGPDGKPLYGGSSPAPTKPTGFIGLETSGIIHSGFTTSISDAGGAWIHISAGTLHSLGRLVTLQGAHDYFHMLTSQKAADNPNPQSGVRFRSAVGTVQLLHQASQSGLPTVLYLLAAINLSFGILNLIPLLPLDGGHVAIALYEGVRSRRRRPYHADVAKLLPVLYATIFVGVLLLGSSLFLDLRDLAA